MRSLLDIAIVLAIAYLASCGSSIVPEDTESFGYVYAISSLPYVESVEFPESIVEHEPFEVKVALSARLHPEYMCGVALPNPLWGQSTRFQVAPVPGFMWGANYVALETWFSVQRIPVGNSNVMIIDAPASNEATFMLDMPAGDWVLRVSSADSPEWGGLEDQILVIPYFEPPDNPHVIYKEYPFTVLPKTESGA